MLESQVSSIYVVDDEELIVHSLGVILRREGFDVSCFTDPLQALDSIHRDAPDLLISDVMMPQLSGFDLAIQTRRHCPDCKILLFSAAAPEQFQKIAKAGHDFRLLQKPVHPTQLLHEIEQLAFIQPICSEKQSADRPCRT